MRPSDMDAIARVVAQQVKEIVDKKLAGMQPPEPPPVYDDTVLVDLIDAQSKQIAALTEQLDVVNNDNAMLNKTGMEMLGLVRELQDEVKTLRGETVRVDEMTELCTQVGAIDEALSEFAQKAEMTELRTQVGAMDDGMNALANLVDEDRKKFASGIEHGAKMDEDRAKEIVDLSDATRALRVALAIPTMDDHHKQVIAAVEVAFDEEWQHKFAAMIPDSLDEDRVVADAATKVHDLIVSELGDMVVNAIPEPIPGKDADPDLIRGQVLDKIMAKLPDLVKEYMPEAPKALPPTELQVIEGIKAMYPSIRHDLLNRMPVPTHKGTWSADLQYDVGDEVTKNNSTFRLMEPSTDAPPSPAWQLVSGGSRGKQGKPGKDAKGEQGDPGVGLKEVVETDGMLVFEFTNGDVYNFDMKPLIEAMVVSALNPPEE